MHKPKGGALSTRNCCYITPFPLSWTSAEKTQTQDKDRKRKKKSIRSRWNYQPQVNVSLMVSVCWPLVHILWEETRKIQECVIQGHLAKGGKRQLQPETEEEVLYKREDEGKRTSDCLGSSKRRPDSDGREQDSHAITGYTKRERNRSWSPVTRKCSSAPFSCSLSPNESDDGTCKKESDRDRQADRRHFRPRRRSPSINGLTHERAELSMQSQNNR